MSSQVLDEVNRDDNLPRVVFDCMLFLQAVGKGNNHAYACLKLAIEGKVLLCMSEDCLEEIGEVLRRPILATKFPMLTDERVDQLIDWLRRYADFRDPVPRSFEYLTDPKDEPYINLAIQAGAVFLVSWDRHIKQLADPNSTEGKRFIAAHPKVRVVDPKEFLADYYRQSEP